jgi:hypothetical protein
MVPSVLALPEHLAVFERGIASRRDFAFAGRQSRLPFSPLGRGFLTSTAKPATDYPEMTFAVTEIHVCKESRSPRH